MDINEQLKKINIESIKTKKYTSNTKSVHKKVNTTKLPHKGFWGRLFSKILFIFRK